MARARSRGGGPGRGPHNRVERLPVTAGDVVAATGGRLHRGDARQAIERISIDSRTVAEGDFFVAIRGDRFDGHQFVGQALAHGAGGAMIDTAQAIAAESAEHDGNGRSAAVLVEVADTTRALQDLARDVRRRAGARVVAITAARARRHEEIVAEFLSARYQVFRNKGNLNTTSPATVAARAAVAAGSGGRRLGIIIPARIRTLVGIAEPDIRVWTNVGDAHLGFFRSSDEIAARRRRSSTTPPRGRPGRERRRSAHRGRIGRFGGRW